MLVLNLTPDSFSDGGQFWSNHQVFKRILELRSRPPSTPWILDLGVASTAPSAPATSLNEEIDRWEQQWLMPLEAMDSAQRSLILQGQLSFDTYRPQCMEHLLERLRPWLLSGQSLIYWNDVSPCYRDPQVLQLLSAPYPVPVHYISSWSTVSERELMHRHSSFSQPDLPTAIFIQQLQQFWSEEQQYFQQHGLLEQMIFDPAFGFGKTREQNIALLAALPTILESMEDRSVLIGLSRKSFLRTPGKSYHDSGEGQRAQWWQAYYLGALIAELRTKKWNKDKTPVKITFRCHDQQELIWLTSPEAQLRGELFKQQPK